MKKLTSPLATFVAFAIFVTLFFTFSHFKMEAWYQASRLLAMVYVVFIYCYDMRTLRKRNHELFEKSESQDKELSVLKSMNQILNQENDMYKRSLDERDEQIKTLMSNQKPEEKEEDRIQWGRVPGINKNFKRF